MYDPKSMSCNNCVILTEERYSELVKKEERINVLERIIAAGIYTTLNEVVAILNINNIKEKDNA